MIKEYTSEIQPQLEEFFEIVLNAAGWGFYPEGRHSPLRNIYNEYPRDKGGFWLYYLDNMIIGTVAVRSIDNIKKIAELKCMYVLPEYQGRRYGKKLLKYALEQAESIGYRYIRLRLRLLSRLLHRVEQLFLMAEQSRLPLPLRNRPKYSIINLTLS